MSSQGTCTKKTTPSPLSFFSLNRERSMECRSGANKTRERRDDNEPLTSPLSPALKERWSCEEPPMILMGRDQRAGQRRGEAGKRGGRSKESQSVEDQLIEIEVPLLPSCTLSLSPSLSPHRIAAHFSERASRVMSSQHHHRQRHRGCVF
jgi:hypothetical protein